MSVLEQLRKSFSSEAVASTVYFLLFAEAFDFALLGFASS